MYTEVDVEKELPTENDIYFIIRKYPDIPYSLPSSCVFENGEWKEPSIHGKITHWLKPASPLTPDQIAALAMKAKSELNHTPQTFDFEIGYTSGFAAAQKEMGE